MARSRRPIPHTVHLTPHRDAHLTMINFRVASRSGSGSFAAEPGARWSRGFGDGSSRAIRFRTGQPRRSPVTGLTSIAVRLVVCVPASQGVPWPPGPWNPWQRTVPSIGVVEPCAALRVVHEGDYAADPWPIEAAVLRPIRAYLGMRRRQAASVGRAPRLSRCRISTWSGFAVPSPRVVGGRAS